MRPKIPIRNKLQRGALPQVLAAAIAAWTTGCATTDGEHSFLPGTACQDIPPGAMPAVNGTYACQWQRAQQELAENDDFVIYQREWNVESTGFGPAGYRHVNTLAERLLSESVYRPVLVEPSGDQKLDETRVQVLAGALLQRGVTDAAERIRIAVPAAEPLYGVNAPAVARGYISRGVGGGTTGGTSGGINGSGGSFRSGGGGGGFGY